MTSARKADVRPVGNVHSATNTDSLHHPRATTLRTVTVRSFKCQIPHPPEKFGTALQAPLRDAQAGDIDPRGAWISRARNGQAHFEIQVVELED